MPPSAVPELLDLRAEGGTDYVLHLIWFAPGTALKGVAISFATDTPSGFSDDDMAVLDEVLPALGLAMCKFSLSRTLQEALATYLGSETSARVLEGNIRRGEGETVAAAILLADFRGFTTLTDQDDPVKVVGWLDEHFDAIGEPVTRCGGEILKFMGDGFLAIFPVADPENQPCAHLWHGPGCRGVGAGIQPCIERATSLQRDCRNWTSIWPCTSVRWSMAMSGPAGGSTSR